MCEIEKNIPIAKVRNGRPRGSKYPFSEMAVGDSFFATNIARGTVNFTVYSASKRLPGRRFSYREENGGYRIWRVE